MFKIKRFFFNPKKQSKPGKVLKKTLRNKTGVLIVEYALLLVICVTMAGIIKEIIEINKDPQRSGSVIKIWYNIIEIIAEDTYPENPSP